MAGMKLTKSVTFFMGVRGYLYEAFVFGRKAVEVARKGGKTADLAWLLVHGIGWEEINSRNLEKGEALIKDSLKIYEELSDSQGINSALLALGTALRYRGDFEGARQYYEKGMALAKSSNAQLTVAGFKRGLSMLAASEGKLMQAKEGLESILAILRDRDELGMAGTLGDLAEVNRKLGHYDAAFHTGSEGLELAKKMKKRYAIGWISLVLANTEAERGKYHSALSYAKQALEFLERSRVFLMEIEEVKTLIKELQEKLTV